MFIASLIAVFETNLKRMLAYSSVAQIGYITLGIGLANQAGLTGGLVHLVNHALMKAALFLAVGAIVLPRRLGAAGGSGRHRPQDAAHHGGLRRSPVSASIGVPGTAGFISKWYLARRRARQGLVAAGLPDRRQAR